MLEKDTYFLDSQTALCEALKKNKVSTSNPNVHGLQLCYYGGDCPLETAPRNCIYVPLENIYNFFTTTTKRIPQVINFENTFHPPEEKITLKNAINDVLEICRNERKNLVKVYLEEIKKRKINFTDNKLRIFIPTCRETTVMQYISKSIADSFDKKEVDVFFHIQDDMENCDILASLVNQYNFNPHITININHLNNNYLNADVFNFIWFQDPMPILINNTDIKLRKRDFVFSLTEFLDEYLKEKNIPFQRQGFCINTNNINFSKEKKDNKILFIGSSYKNQIKKDTLNSDIIHVLFKHFKNGKEFTKEYIDYLSKEYNLNSGYIESRIIPYVIRDYSVIEMCKLNLNLDIEIYGWGWEEYEETNKFFKGSLKKDNIINIFSKAKYTLAPHSNYVIQQRVLEASISGCQPILYDCTYNDKSFKDETNTLFFYKSLSELESILTNIDKLEIKEDKLYKFAKKYSYNNFVNKILKKVEEENGKR